MSGPFLPTYDSWRTRTPAEYSPPEPEREGPDPDAEMERLLERYERNRQEEAEGPEPTEEVRDGTK
jgi:hypothetical protein